MSDTDANAATTVEVLAPRGSGSASQEFLHL